MISFTVQDNPFAYVPLSGNIAIGQSATLAFPSTHVFAIEITPDKGFDAIIGGATISVRPDNAPASLVTFLDTSPFSALTIDATHANMSYGPATPTPEPATFVMVAIGCMFMAFVGKRAIKPVRSWS